MKQRRRTTTSNFGVGARESHDATPFYDRFRAPELSDDDRVPAPTPVAEPFVCGDARHLDTIEDGSVALVVTSPPYFAGKQYEEELEREGVPSSYLEYLQMLTDVFAACAAKLEPGGRIAVNVANLGRKPYRSLSADVIRILEHDLGLLLRGELIWQKGEGASGSCAWGSFRSPANPVLRDITERVIVASKGRFDRARTAKQRQAQGLPHRSTIMTEDFLALTLDIWSIPPESAKRVGHPAPFPVELPEQLIRLYTYEGDLVLDPFMGSGSTLVAAALLDRRYIGYDLDPAYVDIARQRVQDALAARNHPVGTVDTAGKRTGSQAGGDDGRAAAKLAEQALEDAGFTVRERDRRIRRTGVAVSFVAADAAGQEWWFDLAGPSTSHRGGLLRNEVVWRSLGRAAAVRTARGATPYVLLTTALPKQPGEGDTALRAAGPDTVFDVVDLLADGDAERLRHYAKGGAGSRPRPGFWTAAELPVDPPTPATGRTTKAGRIAKAAPARAGKVSRRR
ncbi:MAG: site-specific DNA-methyltransferase [Acidimicrobiia bacterium]